MRKHNNITIWSTVLAVLFSLASCGKVEEEYTTHECYFNFNSSYHNTSLILTAVTSYETFNMISKSPISGSTYRLHSSLYGGQSGADDITLAKETQQSCILGLNNGLIVGKSTLNNIVYAYDLQCPNCFASTNRTNYKLSWADNPQSVKCNTCNRTYNLSNGGVVSAGDAGSNLLRYRCSFDGTYLRVQNR